MNKLVIVLFLILSVGNIASAQFPANLLKQLRQIRLLESNRDNVKLILREYDTRNDDSDHYQTFSTDDVDIEVNYADGTCADDSDSDDASEIWNVAEWKVTRIEITPNEAIKFGEIDFDLSKFKKDQRYPESPDSFVLHDKVLGLAFKTTEDGIEKIIVFPSRGKTKQLCRGMTAVKGFYTRRGWFSLSQPYDQTVCYNGTANVVGLDLGSAEIDGTLGGTVAVSTIAVDPDNDVLTYNYQVSGGQIIGTGAKVVWDLTGLAPGDYTITAGVDDGCGLCGKTMTKRVAVK